MKKILTILVCMLMISTIFPLAIDDLNVKASGQSSNENNILDYQYMWNLTENFSYVVYNAYDSDDLPKGRSYGSKGEKYTIDEIILPHMNLWNLENVKNLTIEHIDNNPKEWDYTTIINMTDFRLTIHNSSEDEYPFENPMSKKELFVIPCGIPPQTYGSLTANYSFNDSKIIYNDMCNFFPLGGTLNNFFLTVSDFNFLTDFSSIIVGNVTYLDANDTLPDIGEQYGRVFLFDDTEDSQSKMENITCAIGGIIIDSGSRGLDYMNASKSCISIVGINNSDGNTIKELLENETVLVDSATGNLTFTYNLSEGEICDSEYILIDEIPDHKELWNIKPLQGRMLYGINSLKPKDKPNFIHYLKCVLTKSFFLRWLCPRCSGIIIYDKGNYHYMLSPTSYWKNNLPVFKWFSKIGNQMGGIPIFTMNHSVGDFLHKNCTDTTISGHAKQTYLQETDTVPAVHTSNVIGNLTIDKSPDDAIAIISNRMDGMWGQTPGDSGVGGAILLGIAKYMSINKDSIKRKYNISFLFTTGEEYGMRGAFHFNDSHRYDPQNPTKNNIKYWIILDQLGFDQEDCALTIRYFNNSYLDIIKEIANNQIKYYEKTGYTFIPKYSTGGGSELNVPHSRSNCIGFAIVKDQDNLWDHWHRTGRNYNEGDCLNNTDQNDVNITADLTWALIKYLLVNPDCCFNQSIVYTAVDSPLDGDVYNDSINATVSIQTSLPQDNIRVKAIMKNAVSNETVFWKNFDFSINSSGLQETITMTIPPTGDAGYYKLELQLFNSTGLIDDNIGSGDWNDTDSQPGSIYLVPRGNTIPNKPNNITGPEKMGVGNPRNFTTNTTDSNLDQIQYQWAWDRSKIKWSFYGVDNIGPYEAGENCTIQHAYVSRGMKLVQVRARDDFGRFYNNMEENWKRYSSWSEWSDPFYVNVKWLLNLEMSCTPLTSSQTVLTSPYDFNSIPNINSLYNAVVFGGIEPYTYTWNFNEKGYKQTQQTSYNFSVVGENTVTLNVTDDDGYSSEISVDVDVVNLSASYNTSILRYISPNNSIYFNDTSACNESAYITNWTWDFDDGTVNYSQNTSHCYDSIGLYNVTLTVTNNQSETNEYYQLITVDYDWEPPEITYVSATPSTVGFGSNITILTIVSDNISGVGSVWANITYPDNTSNIINMTNLINDTYYGIFNDTWLVGEYNFTIYAYDNNENNVNSSGHGLNVTVNASVSICTIKDTYGPNEYINLTDPPIDPPYLPLGYELMDDGEVLHIWNTKDSYYFNTSSGIQLTNHKDDYWSHNVLMLGYYNNDQWNLLYRTDELTGFSKSVDTDNLTYVNATLWKDLSYNGYEFRLALRYHLKVNDTELTIIPYIKNIDNEDISYTLGFGWEITDIQICMTPEHDYIDINGSSYYLNNPTNATIDNTYTDLPETHLYIHENQPDNTKESLYLAWDNSLTYKVQVKDQQGQYNAPVTLFIRIGTLSIGQKKQTELLWHDETSESQITYYFNQHDETEIWTTNPDNMIDGDIETVASTTTLGDVELCDGNTCTGTDLGDISKVELRVKSYYSLSQRDTILRPVFSGETEGSDYAYVTTTFDQWSSYFNITEDDSAPETWSWSDIQNLDCDVECEGGLGTKFNLYCSKIEIRVTYTPNAVPSISNPSPTNGSTGIPPQPSLSVTVNDGDDDPLNATWYSNSSGSWQLFASNTSISTSSGAVTITQCNTNFSNYTTSYYWSVNVTDGTDWNNKTYHFTTGTIDTNVNTISPYLQTTNPLNITATGYSGLDNVTLWYRYSSDNETWGNASWWNSSWDKRRQINLNVSSGSTPVNYQMLMNITYLSGMNTDFSDLRFINYSDNSTELDYWIQEIHNGSWCHVWVEFPSSITTTNTTHAWLYYGNPSAGSNSNGSNTFLFFDDFSGSSLNSTRWPTQSGSITVGDGTVHLDFPGTSYAYAQSPSQDYTGILEFRANYTYDSTIARFGRFIRTHYGGTYLGRGIHIWDSGAYILNTNDPGIYHDYRIVKTLSNALWYFDDVYTFTRSITGNIGTLTLGNSGESGRAGDVWFDHIRIREYSASEPTYHIGVDQIGGWQPWDTASNPDTSSPWQWSFDFPNGLGYYEFYSIGMKNGSADENPPSTADTGCSFRNQSKIVNTGSTNISGYLLIQVQFYNSTSESWVVADDTINETSKRTINAGTEFGLDIIFNGEVNTNSLSSFGSGLYRIYAAFRDPEGNVLVCDDETKLEATHQFTITFS